MKKIKESYGSKERRNKRKRRINTIHNHVDLLISTFLPELTKLKTTISKENYVTQLHLLLEELQKKYPTINEYREGNNHLAKFINKGNKDNKWQLEVPGYIIPSTRERPLRTEKWFVTSKNLNQWEKKWQQYLASKPSNQSNATEEEILSAVMISAALYGGLCMPDALVALANQLRTDNIPLFFDGEGYWIDLVYNSKSQANNVMIGDKPQTLRRWYPDPVSLAWIHNFLSNNTFLLTQPQALLPESYWKQIKTYLIATDNEIGRNIKSFKLFCDAAIGVVENYEGVHLNEALTEYALGKVPSASLPSNFQAHITQSSSLNVVKCKSLKIFKRLSASTTSASKPSLKNDAYESIISNIRQAIKPKVSPGTKSTPARALVNLEELLNQPLSMPLKILISWLEYLLKEKPPKKVSSVNQYFSLIGKDWILGTINQDIYALDELDFQNLYTSLLDSETYSEKLSQKTDCFERFHEFAHRQFDLEYMDSIYPTSTIKKKKAYVRAGYITEHDFLVFCKSLQATEYYDRHVKSGLQILYLLAFRAGLRRGELLKLRIKDIQVSSEYWIYVRNNRFGDNKSSSGSRKIPLSLLLTPEEKTQFEIYLSERKLLTQFKPKALLFSLSQTHYVPLDGNWVSSIAKYFLQEITGLSFVFHHFKHTTLSRLQVVLEGDKELINLLSPYTSTQVKNIQSHLGSFDNPQNRRDIYWALAGIAGHLTPETTFAHYLHFSDRLLANKLGKAEVVFSASAIREISDLSSHTIIRCCNSKALNSKAMKLQDVQASIMNNLKKFGQGIRVKKTLQPKLLTSRDLKSPLTIELCHIILKQTEQGATQYELATSFRLDEERINNCIRHARNLANLKTSKNKSRLFSCDKAPTIIGEPLAPSLPQSTVELIDANRAIDILRDIYKKQERKIKWCIKYYLKNTHTSSSGLVFQNPKELKRFFKLMLEVYPAKRWHIRLMLLESLPQDVQVKEWKTACQRCDIKILPKTVRQKRTFPYGRLELYLTHPSEQKLIQASEEKAKKTDTKPYKKYSSNTIRYIFHMIAIMRS